MPCCIQSVEDHGYIVDFGVLGKLGFVRKEDVQQLEKMCRGTPLEGQVAMCRVLRTSETKAVSVAMDPDAVFGSVASGIADLSSIRPGTLVTCTVRQVTPRGLHVTFNRTMEGSVSVKHVPDYCLDRYKPGKKVKARVLWCDMANKRIGFTLLDDIARRWQLADANIGNICYNSKVVHVNPRNGVHLEMEPGSYGYAPLPLMYDDKSDKVLKQHGVGTVHTSRIVQYNLMDCCAIVCLRQSVLDEPYLKCGDIEVGSVVTGTVSRITDKGVYVSLAARVEGYCPNEHMVDVRRKNRQKGIKDGARIKCRVLLVDVANRFVLLTCKKSFVNSPRPPLIDASLVEPGQVYDGQILAIWKSGLVVGFYNSIKGFVPSAELFCSSMQVILDASTCFVVGQVVVCRVVAYDRERKRFDLSLKLDPLDSSVVAEDRLQVGEVMDLEVTSVAANGVTVTHQRQPIFLPLELLSDDRQFGNSILKQHSAELEKATMQESKYAINDVLIVKVRSPSRPAIATTKPTIVHAARCNIFPSTFKELKVGHFCFICIVL